MHLFRSLLGRAARRGRSHMMAGMLLSPLFSLFFPMSASAQDSLRRLPSASCLPLGNSNKFDCARLPGTFTLDDLIPGGKTYYASSVPENRHYAFWGERAVRLEVEQATLLDGTVLLRTDDIEGAHSLLGASFPLADAPVVELRNGSHIVRYNWEEGQTVSSFALPAGADGIDIHPATGKVAYVLAHNLYADGEAVSTDGEASLVYGESVHRNEFGIEKGTFWSPDGRRLAFYRMDQSMVSAYPQVNISPAEGRCAQLEPDYYPMAGEASHRVSIGIYDTETRQTVYLQTGDPTDRYFTNIAWAPDGQTLYLIELNRDQTHASLDAYDPLTGARRATLFTEDDARYVEPMTPIRFLPWDDSRFLYESRRDGFNHLYLCSTEGGEPQQLTKGEWEVMSVLGFNESQRTIIYASNEDDLLGCSLHSISLKGRHTRLSEADGWHNALLSPKGEKMVDNWSSPSVARRIDLIDTHKATRETLALMDDPWQQFQQPTIRVGTLKAADGQTDLYYRLVLPADFDSTASYPAIVYVYGGPHAHNIDCSRHWGVRGWDVWMAQQGYVMFCLDNRGSEHRGRDFEQVTFRQLGVEEMKDQLCGVSFLKSLPYIDPTRIGVHGWSFGGFMTTSLLTTYPGTFKVGVAGGPVIDWKYYEVMYGERYMDTPQANPDGYAATSCLGKAQNLSDRLLIIYGGNDPVCVPQHTLAFVRACIDAGTHPDIFIYPGDGHNMLGTDRIHLHEHISRYFFDHL